MDGNDSIVSDDEEISDGENSYNTDDEVDAEPIPANFVPDLKQKVGPNNAKNLI